MKNRKRRTAVLCTLLFALSLLCTCANSAAPVSLFMEPQQGNTPVLVENLSWGMTFEQVKQAVPKAGFSYDEAAGNASCTLQNVTLQDAAVTGIVLHFSPKLSVDDTVYGGKLYSVELQFSSDPQYDAALQALTNTLQQSFGSWKKQGEIGRYIAYGQWQQVSSNAFSAVQLLMADNQDPAFGDLSNWKSYADAGMDAQAKQCSQLVQSIGLQSSYRLVTTTYQPCYDDVQALFAQYHAKFA